ncbi:MAG: hypothetical protein JWQ43_1178 [Glaciihabitans sp.]|nr:hypothetical protein [Glaciihabitans sp.]
MSDSRVPPATPPLDAALAGAAEVPPPPPLIARFTMTAFEPVDVPALPGDWVGTMVMRKDFTAGIVGSSVLQFISSGQEPSQGYLAVERITGRLDDGRSGSFTVHHGALRAPGADSSFGYIIPASGTNDFADFAGEALIVHDDDGAFFRFTLRA